MRAAATGLLSLAALLGSSALGGQPGTPGAGSTDRHPGSAGRHTRSPLVGSVVEPPAATGEPEAELYTLEQQRALEKHALSLKVEHHFARADARERVSQLLAYWHKRFGLTSQWRGNWVRMNGTVFGIDINGLLEVTDSCVQGFASDPGLLWRSPGISYVEGKLRKYLHPTYDER